jgi:phage terminase large subunit
MTANLQSSTSNILGYPKKPLEWQVRFHRSKAKYKLLIGGIRAGKTTAMAWETIKQALTIPNNHIFLGRFDLEELKDTLLREILDKLPEGTIESHNQTDRQIKLYNGTTIKYSYLDIGKKADKKVLSASYGLIVVDQVEEIEKDMFDTLDGRLSLPQGTRQFLMTANPNGQDWVWQYFVNPENPNRKKNSEYWLCKTTDNAENLPEDYLQNIMDGKPDIWISRYIEGKFDKLGGNVYQEFDKETHLYYVDPDYSLAPVYIGIDPGWNHPTAVIFIALIDNEFYIFDELYVTKHLPSEVMIKINQKLSEWKIKAIRMLIDPHSVQVHQSQKGLSVYKEFHNLGLNVSLSTADVWTAIMRIKGLFKENKIHVHARCKNFLDEIGKYSWKTPRFLNEEAEEVPKKKHDDLMDAMRYVLGEPNILDQAKYKEVIEKRIKRDYYEDLDEDIDFQENSIYNTRGEIDWQSFL